MNARPETAQLIHAFSKVFADLPQIGIEIRREGFYRYTIAPPRFLPLRELFPSFAKVLKFRNRM
jgi:hypothetical protein